jgi:nucleolar complex protein 3
MILQTFIDVFKSDHTSVYSQTLLRLIARMIKERKFQVHPNILSCLLHLRLRSELDMMREKARKGRDAKERDRRAKNDKAKFKSEIRKKWQTKNQKKREKEMKEVEKEMGEAAAEVDLEERANIVSLSVVIIEQEGQC